MMAGFAYTPWIWPMIASAAFTGAVGAYLWRRRETPGAFPLALMALVTTLWCLANAAEISAVEFGTQRTWFAIRDALALPGVLLALWFALEYAGLRRLMTRPIVAVLIGSVLVRLPVSVIDDGRHYWSRMWWDGGVRVDLAPLGALFSVYGFALYLLATAIFVLLFVRSPAHRVPVALILLGQVSVRVAYPLGALNIADVPYVPIIILAFDFATLMYVIAFVRFRFFDVVPVARETIIERIPDAMLVVDAGGRLAALNRAAARLLGVPRPDALGRPATEVLHASPDLVRCLADSTRDLDEVPVSTSAGTSRCQVAITALTDWQGQPIGRLVMLHDITELRRTQERLLEHERALAIADEREHMARDLHDSIGQVLGYVSMQADATRRLLTDGRQAEADGQLTRLADVAREAHADVRGFIEELHETAPESSTLLEALRRQLDGFTRNYGVATALTAGPELDSAALGHDRQVQLLRIVQEALTNARRHGEAHTVRVDLGGEPSWTTVVIEDDGRGFDPAAIADENGRHGLRFMRERARQLDGDLEVRSSPGRGTRVVVRARLDPGARKSDPASPAPLLDAWVRAP